MHEIPGTVPAATESISGCPFAERCGSAFDQCRRQTPRLATVQAGRQVSCWLYHNRGDEKAKTG
jgi:oligopeptide/dipeptide ABC transporter ATP-binding protein